MITESSVALDLERPFLIDPDTSSMMTYGNIVGATEAGGQVESPLFSFYRCLLGGLLNGRELTVGRDAGLLLNGVEASEMEGAREHPSILSLCDLRQRLEASTSTLKLFTSGTTGRPQSVTHQLKGLLRGVRTGSHHAEDVWGLAYQPSHIAGLLVFFQALLNANTMVLLNGLPLESVTDVIEDYEVTHISATPTFYRMLPARDRAHSHVRRLTFGGEALDEGLLAKMRRLFPEAKILNVYASTEAGSLMEAKDETFQAPPELAAKARVINGELHLHRSLLGRLSNDAQPEDDWYATGDLVRESENGIQFEGRRCQEINTGGHKVNPMAVERSVRRLPGVKDCRVFGRSSSVLGQIVCCQVVRDDTEDATEKDLREELARELSKPLIPRVWEFVDSLDVTDSGKRRLVSDE